MINLKYETPQTVSVIWSIKTVSLESFIKYFRYLEYGVPSND